MKSNEARMSSTCLKNRCVDKMGEYTGVNSFNLSKHFARNISAKNARKRSLWYDGMSLLLCQSIGHMKSRRNANQP